MNHCQGAAVLNSLHGGDAVLEEMRISASVDDLLAEIEVVQRYRNPGDTNIEAVYTFPLPLDGVLLGFEVEIGSRKLAGAVFPRSEAERRYEDAVTDGDAAVLLEQAEPGLYTASLGNLLPGETAAVRLRYGLLLRWSGEKVRLFLPTTIAPRYGDPAAAGLKPHQNPEYVLDAERSFGVRATMRGLLRDARLNSPSHKVRVTPGPAETVVETTGRPAMDRDFVLEARLPRSDAGSALVTRDLDGWAALASFRPAFPADERPQPRSVKIVVDCSGSMGGDSIAQARAALERILDGLREGDWFEIIAFGNSQKALFGGETAVSEATLARARQFVRGLDADLGGTELAAALDAAYAARDGGDLPRDLLLITDGQIWAAEEAAGLAADAGHRIFAVGVGSAVAEAALRGLAEASGGALELVAPREDMAERVHRHFQRMYAPCAANAAIRWPADPRQCAPRSIEAVHEGDTLHVFAWFAEKPEGSARLEVTLEDGRTLNCEAVLRSFEEASTAAQDADGNAALPPTLARLAAARRLADLADPADQEAAAELAVRYQLMSPWTSCIVVHVRAEGEKADELPDLVKIPQILAAGWHGLGSVAERRVPHAPLAALMDTADFEGDASPAAKSSPPPRSIRESRSIGEFRSISGKRRSRRRAHSPSVDAPVDLVKVLNARARQRPAPDLPTLDDLRAWGVPDEILDALLVIGGDEEAVVAGFLHGLAESEAGAGLERRARRQIVKAWKTASRVDGGKSARFPAAARAAEIFADWEDEATGLQPV